MNGMRLAWMLAALIPTAALAVGKPTVNLHLQPGQWSYRSVVKVYMGTNLVRTVTRDWQVCTHAPDEAPMIMPEGTAKLSCTKPALSPDGEATDANMTCTSSSPDGVGTIQEFMAIVGKNSGKTAGTYAAINTHINGTTKQELPLILKVTSHGTWRGTCR